LTTVGITFARSAVFDGPWNAVVNMLDGMRSNEDEIESDDEQERLESVHDEQKKEKDTDTTRQNKEHFTIIPPLYTRPGLPDLLATMARNDRPRHAVSQSFRLDAAYLIPR